MRMLLSEPKGLGREQTTPMSSVLVGADMGTSVAKRQSRQSRERPSRAAMGPKLRETFTVSQRAAGAAAATWEEPAAYLSSDEEEVESAKGFMDLRYDIRAHYADGEEEIARLARERREERRRREEEMARRAEEARREQERQAAAEAEQRRREAEERERRRRQAAEAKARQQREAEEEAMRRAEEARSRRRQEEAAAAAARVAAATSASLGGSEAPAGQGTATVAEGESGAAAAAGAAAAPPARSDAYLEVVTERRARAERAEELAERMRGDRAMSSTRAAVRLRGAGQVSKLSATEKQVRTVAESVVRFFQAEHARWQAPDAFEYAAFQVAARLVDYARDPQSDSAAFAAARTSRMIEAHVEGFEEAMECAIARACPLLGGQWLVRSDFATADDFNRAFGHRSGEDAAAFRAAIHALARFCGARWQTRDEQRRGTGAPGIGDAWRWLARTLNRAPRTETLPAFLSPALLGVLETAGRELNFQYRGSLARLIRYIQRFVVPRLPRGGQELPDVARHHTELCRLVDAFAAQAGQRDLPVPAGLPLPVEDARNM